MRCVVGAGAWYHMSLFFNSHELGLAYAAIATATAIGQVPPRPDLTTPVSELALLLGGRHVHTPDKKICVSVDIQHFFMGTIRDISF